jgi:DNA-binding CsgD family transcriptional regulator
MSSRPFSGNIKFYHVFLAIIFIIVCSSIYVSLSTGPLDPDILEKIREHQPNDIHQIEKNKMQILFMKERGWNFIIFSCLVLSIFIWMVVANQRKSKPNFMGYKFRLQDKFSQLEMQTLSFQNRLKKKFDLLTSNDLLVAEMLVDGYSTKKISAELNISVSSANTARYRLRKKMKLSSETDLVVFLRDI